MKHRSVGCVKISSGEKVSEFGRKKPKVSFLKVILEALLTKKYGGSQKRTNCARVPIFLATRSCSGGAVLGIRALCAQREEALGTSRLG